MAVIILLAALLLPAVQSAREAAKRTECQNHLRQIALACLAHEQSQRHLPTGGWGWRWQGDPDRGFGRNQPGGWTYNILPYLEHTALRERGAGYTNGAKEVEIMHLAQVALPVFHCPSRRAATPYPFVHPVGFVNMSRPSLLARCDYSACVGDLAPDLYGPGPTSVAEGDSRDYSWDHLDGTGVVFRRSELPVAAILDGASHTYLVGEGYLCVEDYSTGKSANDDQGIYVGYDRDTLRCTHPNYPALRDNRTAGSDHSFGSAHAQGFHISFCDGSVRVIRYTISSTAHERLGSRADGRTDGLDSL